jgi:threonyl-tRNA synthetase
MIHRAPFGSMERFIGILIEHFEGAFPTWLAPVQVVVATISEKSVAFAGRVVDHMRSKGLRAELDDSPERIGPKKHRARKMKIPYIAVVGEQEVANRTVNVNDRDGRQLDDMGVDDFLAMLLQENRPQADMPAAQTAGADCFRPPE